MYLYDNKNALKVNLSVKTYLGNTELNYLSNIFYFSIIEIQCLLCSTWIFIMLNQRLNVSCQVNKI